MFERQSMEQLLNKMVRWTRGSTPSLTDFRVGSKIRTIYESTALVVEELYDKVHRALKTLIEENIYSVIGFDKGTATYTSGQVVMSRLEPADDNYLIPAGTTVLSKATQFKAPIQYRTTEDALLPLGETSVIVPVVALVVGLDGNVVAGGISEFLMRPSGIESVTNLSAFTNGQADESKEAQKARFQKFIEANGRGTLQAVEYGASQVYRADGDMVILESVKQAVSLEYLPERKGEVDVYVWNGVGEASEELITLIQRDLKGYYADDGSVVYGYKTGGIITNVYSAPTRRVVLKLAITSEAWTMVEELQPLAEQVVDLYFGSIRLGQKFVQTALEAQIKQIEGVYDVKLYVSVDDGESYTTDNVEPLAYEVVVPTKPLLYE